MQKSVKISVGQVFCILLLSRLLSLLTYTTLGMNRMQTADYFAGSVFMVLWICIFSLPLLYRLYRYPQNDLVDLAYQASPLLSKGISVLYSAYFSLIALVTLARLELFLRTVIFPNTRSDLYVVICIAAVCYAATLGLEALGRAGCISLFIFAASWGFIMISMADKIDLNQLSPLFYDGVSPAILGGLNAAVHSAEIVMLGALLPKINGKPAKAFGAWLFVWLLSAVLVFFFVFGGLGEYALTQLFPIHSVAVLSEVSVFQRFDVLLSGLWILSAFLKISLLLYLQSALLAKSFRADWKNRYILFVGILIGLFQLFFVRDLRTYFFSSTLKMRVLFFAAFTILVPSIVLLAVKYCRKRREHYENRT